MRWKLLVSGYRDYSDEEVIRQQLLEAWREAKKPDQVTLIHGGCRGVDTVAAQVGRELGWQEEVYKPEWRKNGVLNLGAGPARNEEMILKGKPDYTVIFLSKKSRGTKQMKGLLDKYGLSYTEVQID
jgi:hypothetical protein